MNLDVPAGGPQGAPTRSLGRARRLFLVLRQMGPGWAAYRVKYAVQKRVGWFEWRCPAGSWQDCAWGDVLREPRLAEPSRYLEHRRSLRGRFFFDSRDFGDSQEFFWSWGDADRVAAHADAVLAGRFRFFSWADKSLGFPPDWHVNPQTGQAYPRVHWSRIDDFSRGDVKWPWELSRFPFVFDLVRAYARTGADCYAEGFWRLVEDWLERNPPNTGVNWKCGQEAAVRLLAWLVGLHAFIDCASTTAERVVRLARGIHATGMRIERNLDYALSQDSNHGHSEVAGLFAIGVLFPEFRESARWERKGRRWLERLVAALNYPEGGGCMSSVTYLRMMLDVMLWAGVLGEKNGRPFSAVFKDRVRASAEWLYQLQDEGSGEVPLYGANDGAQILPFTGCEYLDFRPIVQASVVFAEGRRRFEPGPWDEQLWWMHGGCALEGEVQPSVRREVSMMPSGYHVLRGQHVHLLFRCGSHRHRPSHADMLQVDLWWRGVNVACDAGSFGYNADAPFQRALRDTAVHNTVTVDGLDQMERVSRFLFAPWVQGTVEGAMRSADGAMTAITGHHTGYRRLVPPVDHRRIVVRLGVDDVFVIDELTSTGDHEYRLQWLLPDLPHELTGDQNLVVLATSEGAYRVQVGSDSPTTADLVRGAPDDQRGWLSRYYQQRSPGLSWTIAARGRRVVFWSHFGVEPSTVHQRGRSLEVAAAGREFEVMFREEGGVDLSCAGGFTEPLNATNSLS